MDVRLATYCATILSSPMLFRKAALLNLIVLGYELLLMLLLVIAVAAHGLVVLWAFVELIIAQAMAIRTSFFIF
jgi:hypothetical protein